MCRGERVILTGDFNVGETSRSYAILRDSGILSDTYDTAEIRYAETGTENWFDPDIIDALGKENEEQVITATKEKVLAICKRLPVYAN